MAYVEQTPGRARRTRARDRFEYRALVALCFMPCLLVATAKRIGGTSTHTDSIFTEALSSARAAVGYAYLA
ncbi:MAG: hypothetical protein AAFY99_00985 [Pseudomonadota bacterium]